MAHPPELPEDAPAAARSVVAGTGNVIIQIIGDGNTLVAGARYLTLTRYLSRRLPTIDAGATEAAQLSPCALSVPLIAR